MRGSKKKNNIKILSIVAVAAVATGAFFVIQNQNASDATGDVVAELNGSPIYSSEADAKIRALTNGRNTSSFSTLDEQGKKLVINEIAANKLVLKAANKTDVKNSDTIKKRVDEFKNNLIKEEYLASIAKDAVTDEKLKQQYDDLSKELVGKTQYKISHILVKTESEADAAKKKLHIKSFEDVAKSDSIDSKTAVLGGDLGYLLSGGMIKEVEDVVSKMSNGQVSEPVKTAYGWHVLKLIEKRPAEPAPFDQVKGALAQKIANDAVQSYVQELIKEAEIEVLATNNAAETTPAADKAPEAEEDNADKQEPAENPEDKS